MSQFRITAVEGLRTEGEAENVWDGFYTAEKEQKQQTDRSPTSKIQVDNEANYDDDFEEEGDDEEEEDSRSRETPRISLNLNNAVNAASSERLDTESDSQSSTGRPRKKGKGKRCFKGSSTSKPPPLPLYHNQLRDHLHYSKDRSSSLNHDSLSDQEVRRRRGRKLHRRGQMKKYRSLEQAVEQAGRDRLEQKYVELEELMSRPLMDNRRVHVPARQTCKKQTRRPAANRAAKEGESTQSRLKAWISNSTLNEDETTDRQAYSTLRKLQTTTTPAAQKHNSSSGNLHTAPEPNSHPAQQRHTRLTSKPPVPQRRTVSEDSLPSSSSDTSQQKSQEDNSRPQHNGFDAHLVDGDDNDDKFGNVSPRSVYLPTDMHLKYTDNPKLQDWLKRKNVEHRQARKAECIKKREERLQKQSEVEQRQARREKSSERVKQWMDQKRKEAAKQQKEERRRRRQEAQEQAAQKARSADNAVRGSRIDRPQSAPSPPNKKYTPIKRPESAARLENGAYTAPKPPDTKFVYKRPVSGKVRLMKLQSEKKAKDSEQNKLEQLTPEEREQKTRMSYDAWLIAKRREDTEKRREVTRQDDLMKSDPEVDRLVPELAIRRIERINQEKKSIETGVSVIDDEVNKKFGGGSFGQDVKKPPQKSGQDSMPQPSSYSLSVEGSAAASTLIELNARARPVVAKTRMPIPQSTLSPRRPPTAKPSRDSSPKVRAVMDRDLMSEPNPFKLPFSGDFTTSLQIRRIQERVSTKVTTPEPADSGRPEPQGCAASEAAACPKGVDGSSKPDHTPRSSLVLLQQIEAAAVQSELETQQTSSGNTSASSEGEASNPGPGKEAKKLFITEPGQADDPSERAPHQEEKEEVIPVDLGQEKTQDEDTEQIARNRPQNSSPEGGSGPESQEPDAAQEPHKPRVGAALQDAKEREERPEEPSASSPPDPADPAGNGCQASEQNRQEAQSSAAEDSPRRSLKRVSFSEELATVFQSPSPDTSSNFEDERGADDEGEDPHMSLDHVPDPE